MRDTFYHRADGASKRLGELGTPRTESTLAKLRHSGEGPRFHKDGRLVVYADHDLVAWSAKQLAEPVQSTSEYHERKLAAKAVHNGTAPAAGDVAQQFGPPLQSTAEHRERKLAVARRATAGADLISEVSTGAA
jgi:hypothetical protein